MTKRIVVLGGGPGGYVAAVRVAQLGGTVTLIEKENVGGTCLNWGCIPSKIMKTSAELLEKMRHAESFGLSVAGEVQVDMARLMARKSSVIATQIKGIEGLLKHHKISLIKGHGRIEGRGAVTVTMADGSSQLVEYDGLILATGSTPLNIPAFPFDGRQILSSSDVLSLTAVPASMVIIGGGVIGCEFAGILAALGCRVTIVEALDRLLPLPGVDADCSKILQREMKKKGIEAYLQRTVTGVHLAGGGVEVSIGPSPQAVGLKDKEKLPFTVAAEKVLVAIGRSPAEGLGLEALGVTTQRRGWIIADARMRTSIPEVYAIGDALGPEKVMLAHAASAEAMVAAENVMGGERVMDYHTIPSAIFTMPEVGTVGLSEAQALEMGFDVRADSVLFRTIGKAQVIDELAGQAKIVSETGSGRVLGVHLIGAHATDLIAEGALAVQHGLSVAQIAATIHAHPTLAEIMAETALKACDRALHG